MATFKDAASYRRSVTTRMNKMIRLAKNNGAKASIYMSGKLKSTAPLKTGKLASSVRRREIKNGYSVLAGYKKGTFNVGKWVNQEFPITTNFKKFNWYYAPGQTFRYGDFAISPNGKTIVWTARQEPWFDKAREQTIKRYRAGYRNVRMALRA